MLSKKKTCHRSEANFEITWTNAGFFQTVIWESTKGGNN